MRAFQLAAGDDRQCKYGGGHSGGAVHERLRNNDDAHPEIPSYAWHELLSISQLYTNTGPHTHLPEETHSKCTTAIVVYMPFPRSESPRSVPKNKFRGPVTTNKFR